MSQQFLTGTSIDYMSYADNHQFDITSQIVRGTMSFSTSKLAELDPSYTGYTHIFVLRVPPFMKAVASGKQLPGYGDGGQSEAKYHVQNLKALFEMGSTSYSGTPELTLNTSNVSTGWNERNYPAATHSAYDSTSFTINCLEMRGEPLRHGMEYYINGVSDANVKATMLHGALGSDNNLMKPTLANTTWSFMIVQTDQTMLNIQDISLWNNCIITSADRSSLDWDNGTIDIVQPRSVPFQGVYTPDSGNAQLRAHAQTLLKYRYQFYKQFREMNQTDFGIENWITNNSM